MPSWSVCVVPGWTEPPGRTFVLTTLVLLAAAGCQPSGPDAVLSDYVTRVARIVEQPVLPAPPEALMPYPDARDLSVDIPRRTIDIAEFFELHGCDMGALVGLRNSPLGRLQTPSQRLGYEAAWLAALARCGGGAADWAQTLGDDKRALLPALFWNATFAAPELRTAMGGAGAAPDADLADLLRSLHDSYRALGAGSFDLSALEQTLARLRTGSWVGPARQRWLQWRRHLQATSALLGPAAPRLCLNQQPTPRSRRLQNVFLGFYVEQIQPELAREMGRHAAWIEEIERLTGALGPVVPEPFQQWYAAVLDPAEPGSEWQRTRLAVTDHARAWQRLLAACGIEPGAGVRQD